MTTLLGVSAIINATRNNATTIAMSATTTIKMKV